MPTPIQSSTPLARIQPAKQELPSLDQMRADLLSLETDPKQQSIVCLLAGSQRTIVDHLRLMVTGQRMMTQSFKKYVEDNNKALVAEINAVLAGATAGEPQPEATEPAAQSSETTTVWQGPKEEAQAVTVDVTIPVTQPLPTVPVHTPSPNAPQMTVTPVVRKRSTQQQQPATAKAGSK